jgi:hypothetical protein
MATKDHVSRIDLLNHVLDKSDFEFISGDALFGLEDNNPYPHPVAVSVDFVKRALTCGMPVEKNYYTSTMPMATKDHVARIDLLNGVLDKSDFEFISGDALFGLEDNNPYPHPVAVSVYFVKRALTCGMPVEKNYYTSTKKFEVICAVCGTNTEDHLGEDEARTKSKGKQPLPILYQTCWSAGSKPITIGIAKKNRLDIGGKGKHK